MAYTSSNIYNNLNTFNPRSRSVWQQDDIGSLVRDSIPRDNAYDGFNSGNNRASGLSRFGSRSSLRNPLFQDNGLNDAYSSPFQQSTFGRSSFGNQRFGARARSRTAMGYPSFENDILSDSYSPLNRRSAFQNPAFQGDWLNEYCSPLTASRFGVQSMHGGMGRYQKTGRIVQELIADFIQDPEVFAVRHPLAHDLIRTIVHRNLIVRLRTGVVRELLTELCGSNYQENVAVLAQESPLELVNVILTTPLKQRMMWDIKKNIRDNLVDHFGSSTKFDATSAAHPVFEAVIEAVSNPANPLGDHVTEFVKKALVTAVAEEIQDSIMLTNTHVQW